MASKTSMLSRDVEVGGAYRDAVLEWSPERGGKGLLGLGRGLGRLGTPERGYCPFLASFQGSQISERNTEGH